MVVIATTVVVGVAARVSKILRIFFFFVSMVDLVGMDVGSYESYAIDI